MKMNGVVVFNKLSEMMSHRRTPENITTLQTNKRWLTILFYVLTLLLTVFLSFVEMIIATD